MAQNPEQRAPGIRPCARPQQRHAQPGGGGAWAKQQLEAGRQPAAGRIAETAKTLGSRLLRVQSARDATNLRKTMPDSARLIEELLKTKKGSAASG